MYPVWMRGDCSIDQLSAKHRFHTAFKLWGQIHTFLPCLCYLKNKNKQVFTKQLIRTGCVQQSHLYYIETATPQTWSFLGEVRDSLHSDQGCSVHSEAKSEATVFLHQGEARTLLFLMILW